MSGWPLEIAFPWKLYVSANARLGYHGGRLKSRREYRQKMQAARLWARNEVSLPDVLEGPVRVTEHVHPPDARHRDVRNCAKLFEDALEGVVYEDDGQIRRLEMTYHEPDRDNPRVVLTVEPLADGEAG